MGALTLKNAPFELRGWDIEKFKSLDPTDNFGSYIQVYVSKNKIIQVEPLEPQYKTYTSNIWLTDKTRQFFDGIFKAKLSCKNFWLKLLNKIIKTTYMFSHCTKQKSNSFFFTVVFDNLSIESLSTLIFMYQNFSFILLRKTDSCKLNNDLESTFQLNNITNKLKLSCSNLCLLIATNSRYEGYSLNLKIRQRILKGNFKCIIIGSLIDLTFPVTFLGSNLAILKAIVEGNSFICQDIYFSKNPLIVVNSELFKTKNFKNIYETFKILIYSHIFNQAWNGLNTLNSTLCSTGTINLKCIVTLTIKDLSNFSSLYFLNLATYNFSSLKRVVELKLFKKSTIIKNMLFKQKRFLDQCYKNSNSLMLFSKYSSNYFCIPNNTFYENEESFTNTEGFAKRTVRLVPKRKTKNNWQIIRKIIKHFKNELPFSNQADSFSIFFNSKKLYNLKNFIHFQYYATQSLIILNFYLHIKNKTILLDQKIKFKFKTQKIRNIKIKYWLDDFFMDSKDEFSRNSAMLINCSKIFKTECATFF